MREKKHTLLGSKAFPNISFKRGFSNEAAVTNLHSKQNNGFPSSFLYCQLMKVSWVFKKLLGKNSSAESSPNYGKNRIRFTK